MLFLRRLKWRFFQILLKKNHDFLTVTQLSLIFQLHNTKEQLLKLQVHKILSKLHVTDYV